jgi:hypothetical protein
MAKSIKSNLQPKGNGNKDLPVKSITEYIDAIFAKIKELGQHHINDVWFRGKPSDKFKLVSNLYRSKTEPSGYLPNVKVPEKFFQLEQNIDASFHRRSTVFFANKDIENKEWYRYFLKQHYGIQTRLLD